MTDQKSTTSRGADSRIALRLNGAARDHYAREAEIRGIGLSAYLRQRLEASDGALRDVEGVYDALRDIERHLDAMGPERAPTPSVEAAVGVETLMLLRQLLIASGKKDHVDIVRGELKRQGFAPWMPSREGVGANGKSDADSKRSDTQQQSMVDEVARLKELLVAEQHRSNDLQASLSRFKRMTLWGRLAFAFRGF